MFKSVNYLVIALSLCIFINLATSGVEAQTLLAAKAKQQAASPATTSSQAKATLSEGLPQILKNAKPSQGGICTVDLINDSLDAVVTVKKDSPFSIGGWAIDDKTQSAPKDILIQLVSQKNKKNYYAVGVRVERPDVADHFKIPAYKNSGFELRTASVSHLPTGTYLIRVIQVTGKNVIVCESPKKLNIM